MQTNTDAHFRKINKIIKSSNLNVLINQTKPKLLIFKKRTNVKNFQNKKILNVDTLCTKTKILLLVVGEGRGDEEGDFYAIAFLDFAFSSS